MKKILPLFLLLSTALFSQENTPKLLIFTTSMVNQDLAALHSPEELSTIQQEQNQLFEESLVNSVEQWNWSTTKSEVDDEIWSFMDIRREAMEKEMNLILTGILILQPSRAVIQISLYEPATGNLLSSSQDLGRWGSLTFFNSLNSSMDDLFQEIDWDYLEMILNDPDFAEKNRPARIILIPSQPGVTVSLRSGDELFITEDAPLEVPFHPYPLGQEISFLLEKDGFYSRETEVLLEQSYVEKNLPFLVPATSRSLFIRHNYYQLYGLCMGYRHYTREDKVFFNFSDYLFFTPADEDYGSTAIHNDIQIEWGFYPPFSKSTHRFRYGAIFGAGTIITATGVEELNFYNDPYINWLTIFMDWNISRMTLALRIENRFFLGSDNSLLPRGPMEIRLPSENDDDGDSLPTIGLEVLWKF